VILDRAQPARFARPVWWVPERLPANLLGNVSVFARSATFLATSLLSGVPRFFLDAVDGAQVIEDPDGLEFADLETAIAEAIEGARDLVAHGS
jgi:hypothetical protein